MDYGYLPVSRKMFDGYDPIWEGKEPFDRRSAWLDLCQMAAYQPRRRAVGGHVVVLERGQLLASERFLADRWHWPRAKVRRFLELLETKLARITQNSAHQAAQVGAIITLCNYEDYNPEATEDRPTDRPETGPPAAHSRPKIEEGKKEITPSIYPSDTRAEASPGDRDTQITSLVLACNRGMGDNPNLRQYEPILPAHGRSRQVAGDWLAAGIAYETAHEVVYHLAVEYQPSERYRQIGSLTYFDAAVREEHVRRVAATSPVPERRFSGDRRAAPVTVGAVQGVAETAARIADMTSAPPVVRPLVALAREEAHKQKGAA